MAQGVRAERHAVPPDAADLFDCHRSVAVPGRRRRIRLLADVLERRLLLARLELAQRCPDFMKGALTGRPRRRRRRPVPIVRLPASERRPQWARRQLDAQLLIPEAENQSLELIPPEFSP